jgi:CO dehydrogenase maturation factor
MKISVCGKGGSGKSTLVALLALQAETFGYDVIVIDSDESNTGLFRMLGFNHPPQPLMELVGGKKSIKKKMQQSNLFAEQQITIDRIPAEYVSGHKGMKLVSIGKILQSLEGCACPMGVLSREFLSKLRLHKNELAIVDMEAGVEHFGRGIDNNIDMILLVVEPSIESIEVAEKIRDLASGINKNLLAVLNKVNSDRVASKLEKRLEIMGIKIIGILPEDQYIFEACLEGHSLNQGRAFQQVGRIVDTFLSHATE